jgi:hypothetical protein
MAWLSEERGWDRIRSRSKYQCPFCGRRFRNYEARCRGDEWTTNGDRHEPTQPALPAGEPSTRELTHPSNDDEMPTDDFMARFYTGDLMTVNPWWMGQA